MRKKKIEVYSAKGLSETIGKLRLSKREAAKLKFSINRLGTVPFKEMVARGRIRKMVGSDNIYVYKVDQNTRMIISEIEDVGQEGVVIHDVVTFHTVGNNRLISRNKDKSHKLLQ